MRRIVFILVLFQITFVHASSNITPHSYGQNFKYEDLVKLIKDNNLRSVDEVIPLLPSELRSNFTMMHDSLSLQKSTPMQPRVIMFGKDARLVCTFTGQDMVGSDSIECYQYRDVNRSFDFREIAFPTEENKLRHVLFSESDQRAQPSNIRCSSCHSSDPRPNWENYFTWEGAYGQYDDQYSKYQEELIYKQEPGRVAGYIAQRDNLLEFKRRRKTMARYRELIINDDASEFAPYTHLPRSLSLSGRPNARFLHWLSPLVVQRNARIMKSRTFDEKMEFVQTAVGCGYRNFEEIFEKQISVFLWTPAFRDLNITLKESLFLRRASYNYDDGSRSFNFNIAYQIVKELVASRDLPKRILNEMLLLQDRVESEGYSEDYPDKSNCKEFRRLIQTRSFKN